MIGLPISAPGPEKTGRFPCEDCPCGCSTADFCWDKCCCHSDAEKLQWAAQNNVQPPEFLVARVRAAAGNLVLVKTIPTQTASSSACCCCSKSPESETSSCEVPGPAKSAVTESRSRLIRLEDAARCHGIELLWSLFSQVVVDPLRPTAGSADEHLLFCLAIWNDRVFSRAVCPDPPIP
ncbi:hypothetical protein [Stieleria marina]